jgi:hypothetical protein
MVKWPPRNKELNMHTHHLSNHPKIFVNTDGGQTEGQFYIHGPVNFHEVAGSTPPDAADPNRWDRPQAGHNEIVFSMERLKALAEEEGSPTDLLTLEGPDAQKHGRDVDLTNAWFAGEPAEGLTLGRIQIPRTDLRTFWTWQLIPQFVSQLEGMDVPPHHEGSFLSLLGQLQTQLNAWRQTHTLGNPE